MNAFTDEQIKEAARLAALRYFQEEDCTIEDVEIMEENNDEVSVRISWDYASREDHDPLPDDLLFRFCVEGDELYIAGPEF